MCHFAAFNGERGGDWGEVDHDIPVEQVQQLDEQLDKVDVTPLKATIGIQ